MGKKLIEMDPTRKAKYRLVDQEKMEPIYDMFTSWAGRPLKKQEFNLISRAFSDARTINLITKVIFSIHPPKQIDLPDGNQTVIEDYLIPVKEANSSDKRKAELG